MDEIDGEESPHEELDVSEEAVATVGVRLREARLAKGFDLAKVAAETKIPERHLVAIEQDQLSRLPARTYAVGFSRSYARLVGLDELEIADQVRTQMAMDNDTAGERQAKFEPGDPARVPSRGLAWLSVLAIVLLVGGGYSFYRTYFAPGMGPAPLEEQRRASAEEAAGGLNIDVPDGPDPEGQVVFTALEDGVWAKFYDGSGARLYEAQMARGESFAVPGTADNPQIWTGRPDAFSITIGGTRIAPLADGEQIMRDVQISAAALLAREPTVAAAPVAGDVAPSGTAAGTSTGQTRAAPAAQGQALTPSPAPATTRRPTPPVTTRTSAPATATVPPPSAGENAASNDAADATAAATDISDDSE